MSVSSLGQQYTRPSIAPSPSAVALMKHDEIGKQHNKLSASTTEDFGLKPPPQDVAERDSETARAAASLKERPAAKVAASLQDATRSVGQEIREQMSYYQQGQAQRAQVINSYEQVAKL